MRSLGRNKQTIYYATFVSAENAKVGGLYNLDKTVTYSQPVKARMSLSPASGAIASELFGIADGFSHVLMTCDMSCPIDTSCILWIGTDPGTGAKHNYTVVRVAKSLNSIAYAVKEV